MKQSQEFGRAGLVERWVKRTPCHSILDVGCYDGEQLHSVAESVEILAGIDPESAAINKAKKRFPKGDFKVATAEKIPFKAGTFECVIYSDVIEHVDDDQQTLKEIFRVMKPGGRLILTTPHKGLFYWLDPLNYSWYIARMLGRKPRKPYHRHYTLAQLNSMLETAGFTKSNIIHRGGFLICPLIYNIEIMTSLVFGSKLSPVFKWLKRTIGELEFQTDFSKWGYYIGMVVIK